MITTTRYQFPAHVVRAAELAMDCVRDAAPSSEVSVRIEPPSKDWGDMMKATFTFTAPNEKPLQCESKFSGEEDWWPDEGEFLGMILWLETRKAFSNSPAWIAPKEDGELPKCLRPGGQMRSIR
jgi:hypothetical protein